RLVAIHAELQGDLAEREREAEGRHKAMRAQLDAIARAVGVPGRGRQGPAGAEGGAMTASPSLTVIAARMVPLLEAMERLDARLWSARGEAPNRLGEDRKSVVEGEIVGLREFVTIM